jgi:recombination protein RecA
MAVGEDHTCHGFIRNPVERISRRYPLPFRNEKFRQDPRNNEVMDAREKQILTTLIQMDKQFGKGSVLMLGSRASVPVSVISSGIISIDAILGVGGFPRGRVIEIYGPEASGETTLALHVIAEAQRAGGAAAFIDAEHALDPKYANKLGVDTDYLVVSQPDFGEQALEITQALVASGTMDVIVVDSVAALTPKAEIEGEMGDNHMGLHARMMSQALRKLTAAVSRANVCLIFINQIREKIGVVFGNPETTTGGRALKFFASVRTEVRRTTPIKEGDAVIGNRTKIKMVKNKVAAPFRDTEVDILYGIGISREGDLLDLAVQHNLVEKSGSWYSFGGERIGQGRENARQTIIDRPALAKTLDAKLRASLGLPCTDPARMVPASAAAAKATSVSA